MSIIDDCCVCRSDTVDNSDAGDDAGVSVVDTSINVRFNKQKLILSNRTNKSNRLYIMPTPTKIRFTPLHAQVSRNFD